MSKLFQGTYQIHVGGFRVEREALEPTLPEEIFLVSKKKKCRAFFMYGEQAIRFTNGPIAEVYQEAILTVPGVKIKKAPEAGLFNYMPKVFVSRLGPMVINTVFGFPKQLADFRVDENHLSIHTLGGERLVTTSYKDSDFARKWRWFDELKKPTWHLPTLNIVAGRMLEAEASIEPGELVLPSQLDVEFNIPEFPYLPEKIAIKPIAKSTLGGFSTVQNYQFSLAQRLPFNRLVI